MMAKVKCKCGATVSADAVSDTQGDGVMTGELVEVGNLPPNDEWEGGDPACPHEVDEILDVQYPEFEDYE